MSNLNRVVCLLFLGLFCFFELNNAAAILYTFQGGAGCTAGQATPCDFDNGDYWTVSSIAKRDGEAIQDILGNEPTSPALQTSPYDVFIPSNGFGNLNYVLQAQNSSGYHIEKITFEGFDSTSKRDTSGVESTQGVTPAGMTIIFKDTKLHNVQRFQIGSDSTLQTLTFENTIVNASQSSNPSSVNKYSHIEFIGTSHLLLKGNFRMKDHGILTLGSQAKCTSSGDFTVVPESAIDVRVNINGNLIFPDAWNWNVASTYRNNVLMDWTGANITWQGANFGFFNTPINIGNDANDVGKITYIVNPFYLYYIPINIRAGTVAYLNLFYLDFDASVSVSEGAKVHFVPSTTWNKIYLGTSAIIEVKGNASVYFDMPSEASGGLKKRDLSNFQGSSNTINYTIYDGLMQFNHYLSIYVDGTTLSTKSASARIIFDDILRCEGSYSVNYEFASGSTVAFNKDIECHNALPTDGVNYEFGNITYTSPNPPSFAVSKNGSIKLKGSTILGYNNISVTDSIFGGYGSVENDVILSKETGTPKLSLSEIGKTLQINGTLTIPSGSIISITADINSCGKLFAGTLNISSSVSFSLDFIGSGEPPTQNKTYLVAEYTTFTGQLPQSPNSEVFQIVHDQPNKQIKVNYHYIPPPTPTPTEPVAPSNGPTEPTPPSEPSEPTEPSPTPSNTNPTATASTLPISPIQMIQLILVVVSLIAFVM